MRLCAAMLLAPIISGAVTFDEFAATWPDKDIHRARAAWWAIEFPPPVPPPATPDEIAAAQEAERLRPVTTAAAMLEQTAPLLADHPTTNDIPATGLFYRLSETGGVVTLWYARQTDLLATQLSAHNAAGEAITRTVNLRTGEDTTINLRKITAATKFSDLRDAKVTKTNRVGRRP